MTYSPIRGVLLSFERFRIRLDQTSYAEYIADSLQPIEKIEEPGNVVVVELGNRAEEWQTRKMKLEVAAEVKI
ncbi:hypothetical protein SADUNF_Sadunf15G0001700 [Salix dunnii]|uniref:Uncharacterized protein n=1 Tax=Salix dunnii TaxID=1413687 RepID=A0A835MRS9_9ROSI|nr:hypothetical protein SADUNF_Sadunf15G0001700 [Salix dunnii]